MDRAEEIFTMQLARAAGKTANKFLYSRGLQRADRDDVISAALLWCWENRANYSLTTTLETWFMNAVRDAYKNLQRGEMPLAAESIENIGNGDETFNIVAAESSATALLNAMVPADRNIAVLTMQGYTYEDMMAKGITKFEIENARARIKQLRRLLPDEDHMRRVARRASTTSSDDAHVAEGEMSAIDQALERLDFAPPAGKDCPPCWRCMWFEGFMPVGARDTRLAIEDREVREAVQNTEARKIEIAQNVRNGF